MNKNRFVILAAVVSTMALLLSGCETPPTAAAPPPSGPPEVGVIEIQLRPVTLTTQLSGRVTPHMIAEVRPQVGGIIQQRLFTEGSDVAAGQVLYQIDPARYRAVHNSAKAGLTRAEANLSTVRLREERYRELVKIDAVSRQDYDDIRAALKQATAEVEAAEALVESARIDLDYTSVKAPISGRIGRSAVTTGALVTASQPLPLATIQQLDPVFVDVTQSNTELLRLKQSLADGLLNNDASAKADVHLLFEDGTPYDLPGTLKFSEVSVEPSTGSVTLRTLFPNPEQLLLPGMFVRTTLEEGINEEAILVPQRGVTRNPGGEPLVMVVDSEEQVAPRVIQVARIIGDNWLVKSGLEAGDRVILEGIQKVRPGMPVKAVPFGGQPESALDGTPQSVADKN